MASTPRKPGYLKHSSGQARCKIGNQIVYLGKYGSPESRQRYDAICRDWLAGQDPTRVVLTIADLAVQFLEWAQTYFRHPDGTPTREADNLRRAVQVLVDVHGPTLVGEFGPLKLKAVRAEMVRRGWCRTNVNRETWRVRRLFSWAVENELCAPEIKQALWDVPALREGRCEARESEPVRPVEEAIVSQTITKLPRIPATMVRLQLLTGARPTEICLMCPCDITRRTDGLLVYRPVIHKTRHHGKERAIVIGPEGQALLRPFLDRPAEAYCFQPAESEAERNAERRANRKTPMTPSQAKRFRRAPGRVLAKRYTKDSYGRVVRRAAELAGVTPWTPNQLRHTRATLIRESFGIEAASVVLGHGSLKTTEIYAEKNLRAAAEIMRKIG